ncbi:MAG TPA: nucleotidyl transferase AbiEii/AbiGii toxin family protein [Candidatus Acidoferrales bacterium]|nr:nucleotidyl transferase AbiEii/AbiGii toxin family protein [Candidatus Acidoferrales bacterium]
MDLATIRRIVIIAMFSDDVLFQQLTLKGGNALNLVYELGSRSSVDVDLSLETDFVNIDDSRDRIFTALKARFAEAGVAVFDEKFSKRPVKQKDGSERWGGYQIEFKLMGTVKFEAMKGDLDRSRREALVIGSGDRRVFEIQISKYEYCQGKVQTEFQNYSIFVYTPEMIVAEKLRAICQQMPEYRMRGYRTARARDFYDIHSTITARDISIGSEENKDLVRNIFAAKEVDTKLISRIPDQKDFHRPDWASVILTSSGSLEAFDFYFDFVVDQTQLLESLWKK